MGRGSVVAVAFLAVVVLVTACGEEDVQQPGAAVDAGDAGAGEPVGNACPAEGCEIEIVEVVPEGEELRVTWRANYLPDASRNHIHVYWDLYTADQVSADADARGVDQGEWVVTDDYPDFVTEGATSVAERGESTTICVTAAGRDHAVLDTSLVDCRDVADVLDG